ncbi:hypothetical protein SDRG_06028 [Saprolegnia diclina VS20]|uniref:Uncharacterized protein n=1 Tax=Saprolegnia diclina (strain VS20) TaxID=1156394 RepID=T0QF80_SAPDV|nr:hypothetical protein SDRG_06028 [Saprolegnia diclina VS20]EQC36584.1 hypothetical protein SDRG_06028 [Saprolegnia diclina VS20]|eukprot:XP_008610005.1 hypothetical protein SDRG_06028 [Saprolegnia diclina VS20]
MDFRCVSTALDFQVECSTGSIAIGFLDRVLLLIAVIVACNCVCYGLVRALWPVSASLRRSQSLLLTAGAKYLFTHDGWLLGDVYYMDRASALLSGLLTVSVRGSLVLFDVKTWRMQPVYSKKPTTDDVLPPRFETAVPLPDTPIAHFV